MAVVGKGRLGMKRVMQGGRSALGATRALEHVFGTLGHIMRIAMYCRRKYVHTENARRGILGAMLHPKVDFVVQVVRILSHTSRWKMGLLNHGDAR